MLLVGSATRSRRIQRQHGAERSDLPFTGAEVARQLLDAYGLGDVTVIESGEGDGYDPHARSVLLRPAYARGRSISAVSIAAHEVAHAVQHCNRPSAFHFPSQCSRLASALRLLALFFFVPAGLIIGMTGQFQGVMVTSAVAVIFFALSLCTHLASLGLEFDASFKRAMPALLDGAHVRKQDHAAVRSVLSAAISTYVASAGWSLLGVSRIVR